MLLGLHDAVFEQKMFGGLAFLIHGHMACLIVRDELMVRTGPTRFDEALMQPYVHPMELTGRPMRGLVVVASAGLEGDALERWVSVGVAFVGTLPPKEHSSARRPSHRKALLR
jgi:TfoX N-terminal domain